MKKYLCVMLSILLLLSSLMGCTHNKPDSSGNSVPSNPSDSLLGTEATSPSTESTNSPSENTDSSDVTNPTDGSQPTENTDPSDDPESSDGTESSGGMTEPSEDTKPSEGTWPTDPPATEPPATTYPETESKPTEPSVTVPPATEIPGITIPDDDNPFDQTEPPIVLPVEPKPPVVPSTTPPHSHTYSKTVTAPTCTAGGYTTYTCACGDSYVADKTNARGHTYTDTVVPPTPSQKGYTNHVCSCGYFYTDSYVDPIVEEFPYTEAELAAVVVKYINQLRKEEGSPELIPQVGMGNVAQYRSVQLLTNYAHDVKDKREALAYYKYGRYIDMTQYGFDASYNYYEADTQEAIGCFAITEELEERGYRIALGFKNSPAHWSYLGNPENQYVGVGCSKDKDDWYVCIMVSKITYG